MTVRAEAKRLTVTVIKARGGKNSERVNPTLLGDVMLSIHQTSDRSVAAAVGNEPNAKSTLIRANVKQVVQSTNLSLGHRLASQSPYHWPSRDVGTM